MCCGLHGKELLSLYASLFILSDAKIISDCNANVTCNGNGACNTTTGECSCSPSFTGAHCNSTTPTAPPTSPATEPPTSSPTSPATQPPTSSPTNPATEPPTSAPTLAATPSPTNPPSDSLNTTSPIIGLYTCAVNFLTGSTGDSQTNKLSSGAIAGIIIGAIAGVSLPK